MTEAEWLACADPGEMVDFLGAKLSNRKYRLFGCACVRDVWRDLPDDALRQAVETCERFADGLATVEELAVAREQANGTYQGIGDVIADHSAIAVTGLCEFKPWFPMGEGSSGGIAHVATEARYGRDPGDVWDPGPARQLHCELLREIVGNPFRPRPPRKGKRLWKEQFKAWVRWKEGTIRTLAQAAYDSRTLPEGTLDSAQFMVLGDALEEAGCTDAEILAHCRQPGEHVHGCWVLDLTLARE